MDTLLLDQSVVGDVKYKFSSYGEEDLYIHDEK